MRVHATRWVVGALALAGLACTGQGCGLWERVRVPEKPAKSQPDFVDRVAIGKVTISDLWIRMSVLTRDREEIDSTVSENTQLSFTRLESHIGSVVERRMRRASGDAAGPVTPVQVDVAIGRYHYDEDRWPAGLCALSWGIPHLFGVPMAVSDVAVDVTFSARRGDFAKDYAFTHEDGGAIGLWYNQERFFPGVVLGLLIDRFLEELKRDLPTAAPAPAADAPASAPPTGG